MQHPFAERLDMQVVEQHDGHGRRRLTVGPDHLNPHRVVHGAVFCALAHGNYAILRPGARRA